MTTTTEVLDLVVGVLAQEASFQGVDNSGRFRLTLVAVRPADRFDRLPMGKLRRELLEPRGEL